jgi:hypothetical protein
MTRPAITRICAVFGPTGDLVGSGVLVRGSFARRGPDGAPPRGAAAFLATVEQYEGCPAERLDEAPAEDASDRADGSPKCL